MVSGAISLASDVAATANPSTAKEDSAFLREFTFLVFASSAGAIASETGVTESAAAAGLALRECVALAERVRRAGAGEAGESSAFVRFEIIPNILA